MPININKTIYLILVVLMVLTLFAQDALADGVYMPEHAYRKLPEIPVQRAIIRYKDGVETLIVESSLSAEGQSFGWIIPLPQEPTEIKRASSNFINAISKNAEPELFHMRSKWLIIILLLMFLLSLPYIFGDHLCYGGDMLSSWIVLISVIIFFGAIMDGCPKKGGGGDQASPAKRIEIKNRVDIGNYEVTILKANTADDLNDWLEKKKFAKMTTVGMSIVNDYIKNGWVFSVAQLKRKEGGLSTPHPLLVSFPISQPVYPMRLTALSGSNVYLKLFVIAEKETIVPPLTAEFVDKYDEINLKDVGYPSYIGSSYRRLIAEPDAEKLLWPGCILSGFEGKLPPPAMKNDILLKFAPYKPHLNRYYSKEGALSIGLISVLIIWPVGLFIAAFIIRTQYSRKRVAIYMLGICLSVFCLIYFTCSTIEVNISKDISRHIAPTQIELLEQALDSYKVDIGSFPTTKPGLEALVMDPGERGWKGPYLKKSIHITDPWGMPYHYISPGKHGDYDLFTYGEDLVPGGEGASKDIKSWE